MFSKHFKVNTKSGVIECKSFTLKEYISLIISKSNNKSDLMKTAFNDIISTNTNAKDLPKHDAELVLINLIAQSEHQDKIYQDYVCECGNVFPVELNMNNVKVDYNGSDINTLYSFKKFKVSFKWPKLWADDDITSMIANSIDYIFVGDEKISVEELTDEELNDLYDAISYEDINNIKSFLLAPQISLAVPIKCPKCEKSHIHTFSGFKSFLEVL